MGETVLITGATGALGLPTVKRLRARAPDTRFLVLARSLPARPLLDGVHVTRADFSVPGLANSDLPRQLSDVTAVIHMAADVRWNLSLKDAVRVNTLGTWGLLRLLARAAPGVRRFVYVSTVFAEAPSRCQHCRPFLRARGRSFNNSYEVSKWAAEKCVRNGTLPWTIVRPSLIVGDSTSGRIARYNGIYHLLPLLVRGRLPFLLGDPGGFLDVVPVDVAARAVVDALYERDMDGKVVVASSGNRAPTVHEVVDASVRSVNEFRRSHGGGPIESPAYISCERYRRLLYPLMESQLLPGQRRFLQMLDLFHPYLGLSRPLRQHRDTVIYEAGPFRTYGPRFITAWCEDHPGLALTSPHIWSSRTPRTPPDTTGLTSAGTGARGTDDDR
jgi:nucleoside-diphosphate-sugar epimerase